MMRARGLSFALVLFLFFVLNLALLGHTQLASLRPEQPLHWQRTSPTAQQPDGPVLYQLVFTPGTPGTIAKFDNNPRHLINSHITDNGGVVAIGGLSINASTGIVTFAGGQTISRRVTHVATCPGLTCGPPFHTGNTHTAPGRGNPGLVWD